MMRRDGVAGAVRLDNVADELYRNHLSYIASRGVGVPSR